MKKLNQSGFEAATVIVLVLIVAVIGFAGYKVYQNRTGGTYAAGTTAPVKTAAIPDKINSKADLTSANKALDSQNVSGSVSGDALNQDINDML
jgi:Tfp pilus assembly major pilin PilA